MNTSLSWIKMFVPDLDVTAQEYTDAMTLSGTKVEGYELLDADLENIVIGQIEKIKKPFLKIICSTEPMSSKSCFCAIVSPKSVSFLFSIILFLTDCKPVKMAQSLQIIMS